jgi:hypothetical protein
VEEWGNGVISGRMGYEQNKDNRTLETIFLKFFGERLWKCLEWGNIVTRN